jgi:hypothetical protein
MRLRTWRIRRSKTSKGRSEDIFVYGDGVRAHPHLFNSILGRDPVITMYQARQTAQGVEISVVTTAAINAKGLCCALEKKSLASGPQESTRDCSKRCRDSTTKQWKTEAICFPGSLG